MVNITVATSDGITVSLLSVMKPLVDGFLAAVHGNDGPYLERLVLVPDVFGNASLTRQPTAGCGPARPINRTATTRSSAGETWTPPALGDRKAIRPVGCWATGSSQERSSLGLQTGQDDRSQQASD